MNAHSARCVHKKMNLQKVQLFFSSHQSICNNNFLLIRIQITDVS